MKVPRRMRAVLVRVALYYGVCSLVLAPFLGEIAFHPSRAPVRAHAAFAVEAERFGGNLEDVSVTASDGSRLDGWFTRPKDYNGTAVILLHGIGDNREGMTGYAELFLSHGYAVLLPDSRGQGESGGGFPTYGVKETDDVHRWVGWLTEQQHPECVYGMGESMGAALILQAAAMEPRFCAIIAESPFASFRQIAYIRVGQIFHTGKWLGQIVLRPTVELALLYGRITRGIWLSSASPMRAVRGNETPIMLIHGLADSNIPAQQSEMIRSENPSIVLWEVPHAGHCGAVDAAPAEFKNRVLAWFSNHTHRGGRRIQRDSGRSAHPSFDLIRIDMAIIIG